MEIFPLKSESGFKCGFSTGGVRARDFPSGDREAQASQTPIPKNSASKQFSNFGEGTYETSSLIVGLCLQQGPATSLFLPGVSCDLSRVLVWWQWGGLGVTKGGLHSGSTLLRRDRHSLHWHASSLDPRKGTGATDFSTSTSGMGSWVALSAIANAIDFSQRRPSALRTAPLRRIVPNISLFDTGPSQT
jgi:hypothetical protein